MGYSLWFHIPASEEELKSESEGQPFRAHQVLSHYGDMGSFISKIFPLYDDQETVPRHSLPEGFQLADDEEDISLNVGGVPLYYVMARDVAKLEFEHDEVSPLDEAMMAYIRALPATHPLIPYVIY